MTVATEQSLIQKIMGSKIGQEILNNEKQDTLKKRREAVQAIKELNAQAELTIPKLRKENDRELEKVREVEKNLEAAKMKQGEAYRKMQAESHSFDTQVSKHEIFLRETYDPSIDKFLKEMNSLIVHCKETAPEVLTEEQVMDGASLMQKWKTTYDRDGHQNTLSKVGKIYESAQAMKLQAIEYLPAKLKELREGIPRNSYTSGFERVSY